MNPRLLHEQRCTLVKLSNTHHLLEHATHLFL
jgi:hypothetical protein